MTRHRCKDPTTAQDAAMEALALKHDHVRTCETPQPWLLVVEGIDDYQRTALYSIYPRGTVTVWTPCSAKDWGYAFGAVIVAGRGSLGTGLALDG
jgi:hypothetical protein